MFKQDPEMETGRGLLPAGCGMGLSRLLPRDSGGRKEMCVRGLVWGRACVRVPAGARVASQQQRSGPWPP